MRIRLSKSRVWSGLVVCAAVLGLTSFGPVHATDKVEICHFQPGQGSWKLLSVGQSAADAHLTNHDDALPGGTTSQTGTRLDATCQPVTARCPCWDATFIERTFAALQAPTAEIFCGVAPGPGLILTWVPHQFDMRFLATLSGPGPAFCYAPCTICAPPFTIQVFEGDVVTEADILAYESEIRRAAERLGVPCP
jgi:hypothetical protein